MNSRFDTLQAAVILAKLPLLDEEIAARIKIGAHYSELFEEQVVTPYIEPHNTHVYAQYTIQVEDRSALQEHLKSRNIPTAVHYPIPLHLQPAFAGIGYKQGSFPVSEYMAARVMSLPMHPYLTAEQQQQIVEEVVGVLVPVA
jgi:UDP-2-acetamido-2-deoxy-ribo-hexuluronate aminotransferase